MVRVDGARNTLGSEFGWNVADGTIPTQSPERQSTPYDWVRYCVYCSWTPAGFAPARQCLCQRGIKPTQEKAETPRQLVKHTYFSFEILFRDFLSHPHKWILSSPLPTPSHPRRPKSPLTSMAEEPQAEAANAPSPKVLAPEVSLLPRFICV